MTNESETDVVIVGGGIAGLYRAYRLRKASPIPTVLVVEASARWGGRIHTYHEDDAWQVEYGAGRFSRSHRKLWQLLVDMGLSDHIVPNRPGAGLDDRVQSILLRVNRIVGDAEKSPALYGVSLVEYLPSIAISPDDQDYLWNHFGYSAELRRMNALDALQLVNTMVGSGTARRPVQFYSLRGGLSQLVDRLVAWLTQHHVTLQLNTTVKTLELPAATEPMFRVVATRHATTKRVVYRGRRVYVAVPKESLMQWPVFRPLRPWLETVVTVPLCRIYAVFPTDPATGAPWFAGMTKQAVEGPLRWVIPINEDQGIVMAAYTDDQFAEYWHRVWQRGGWNAIKRAVVTYLRAAFPDRVIPYPKKIRMSYWQSGVGYWAPRSGALAKKTTRAIAEHIARPWGKDVDVHILGENYSWSHQQWIEGALA